jgi:hypothetical protein
VDDLRVPPWLWNLPTRIEPHQRSLSELSRISAALEIHLQSPNR